MAVAAPGLQLQRLDIGFDPASFELLCVRVRSRSLSCIVAVVYRPGSVAASTAFFADFTDVIDRLATFVEPIYIVGNINIHHERPNDSAACEIREILIAHGLSNCVSSPTHDLGGLLDVVVCRSDLPVQSIDVIDVGLSDHHLLRWTVPIERETPVYVTSTSRPWKRLDSTNFRSAVVAL